MDMNNKNKKNFCFLNTILYNYNKNGPILSKQEITFITKWISFIYGITFTYQGRSTLTLMAQ